jgi:Xrn1 helical domain
VLTTCGNVCLHQEKTGLTGPDQAEEVARMVKAYVEGLCWVMAYYYDGVASWTWYTLSSISVSCSVQDTCAHNPNTIEFCLVRPDEGSSCCLCSADVTAAQCLAKLRRAVKGVLHQGLLAACAGSTPSTTRRSPRTCAACRSWASASNWVR